MKIMILNMIIMILNMIIMILIQYSRQHRTHSLNCFRVKNMPRITFGTTGIQSIRANSIGM